MFTLTNGRDYIIVWCPFSDILNPMPKILYVTQTNKQMFITFLSLKPCSIPALRSNEKRPLGRQRKHAVKVCRGPVTYFAGRRSEGKAQCVCSCSQTQTGLCAKQGQRKGQAESDQLRRRVVIHLLGSLPSMAHHHLARPRVEGNKMESFLGKVSGNNNLSEVFDSKTINNTVVLYFF